MSVLWRVGACGWYVKNLMIVILLTRTSKYISMTKFPNPIPPKKLPATFSAPTSSSFKPLISIYVHCTWNQSNMNTDLICCQMILCEEVLHW